MAMESDASEANAMTGIEAICILFMVLEYPFVRVSMESIRHRPCSRDIDGIDYTIVHRFNSYPQSDFSCFLLRELDEPVVVDMRTVETLPAVVDAVDHR